MKLRLIVVGRDRRDPLVEIAQDYFQRLQHYFPTELVEVKEEPRTKNASDAVVKKKEAERIQQALSPRDLVVALDEGGRALSSTQLAQNIDDWQNQGTSRVSFVVGGPSGLDREWMATARLRWSLSKLTLPHRLARVVVCEQLYRACTILRNEPYHRA